MTRAVLRPLAEDDLLRVPVATAEDSIIAKLEWFRLGDESSQRQWDDVSRLVALHGSSLDVAPEPVASDDLPVCYPATITG